MFEYTRADKLTSNENFNTFKSKLKMEVNIYILYIRIHYVHMYFFKLSKISCNPMISISMLFEQSFFNHPHFIFADSTRRLSHNTYKYVDRKEQTS